MPAIITLLRPPPRFGLARLRRLASLLVQRICARVRERRALRELGDLDDAQLYDIGLLRSDLAAFGPAGPKRRSTAELRELVQPSRCRTPFRPDHDDF